MGHGLRPCGRLGFPALVKIMVKVQREEWKQVGELASRYTVNIMILARLWFELCLGVGEEFTCKHMVNN